MTIQHHHPPWSSPINHLSNTSDSQPSALDVARAVVVANLLQNRPGLLPPKKHLRIINTYGACARGGGRRPGYEATRPSFPPAKAWLREASRLLWMRQAIYSDVTLKIAFLVLIVAQGGFAPFLQKTCLPDVSCSHACCCLALSLCSDSGTFFITGDEQKTGYTELY